MTVQDIETAPSHVCEGLAVPTGPDCDRIAGATARCLQCGRVLLEGTSVRAVVVQPTAARVHVQRVACSTCPLTLQRTPGQTALAVTASLGSLFTHRTWEPSLVLTDVSVVEGSPAADGTWQGGDRHRGQE